MGSERTKEQKDIEAYLAAKNVKAQKTPKGAYIEILDPGTGAQADSGKFVSCRYKAATFTGKTFDTNMDSSFHHPAPFQFLVGGGSVMQGLDDAIRLLKKGGKAKIFIPAVLGYGPNPLTEGGKPFENIIFDIEILDVKEKPSLQTLPKPKSDTSHRKK